MSKRIGLRHIQSLIKAVFLYPSANAYDNLVGTIWSQFYGAYDNHKGGEIYVSDPSAAVTPQWGGSYDNRE